MASKALEAEIGHGNSGLLPWSAFGDTGETVPELTGSNAIWTYNKMRQDAQIASLLLAVTLPIRGTAGTSTSTEHETRRLSGQLGT